MVLTKRTKYSLTQFLDLFDAAVVHTLLKKYDISWGWGGGYNQVAISDTLLGADNANLGRLVEEIVATYGDLRNRVSPRYRFDERWIDLTKCLLLDGYRVEKSSITRIEPFLEGVEPIEDDLTKELQNSNLSSREEIKKQIIDSAEDFRRAEPDYNGCLSHARIALETLVREIAKDGGFHIADEGKAWGSSLNYLQKKDVITAKEEQTLSSVYTFVSEGSHVPFGFTKEEYVRFGRNLTTSMCYFVIKSFNGKSGNGHIARPRSAGTAPF